MGLLRAFTTLQRVCNFTQYICLPVHIEKSENAVHIYMKFDISEHYEELSSLVIFNLGQTALTTTSHEDKPISACTLIFIGANNVNKRKNKTYCGVYTHC
jgi:hypothetical protein